MRRAKIAYLPGEIARAAEEAEAALIDGGAKLFRRGSNLVRPEVVETTGFKGRVTQQGVAELLIGKRGLIVRRSRRSDGAA
jgi:hypothetical protein